MLSSTFCLGPGAVRLLLAAVVVVSHLSAMNLGRPAVMIFFMISGFWVTRAWQEWAGGTAGFMASRFLRIYPLFLFVALANALLLFVEGAHVPDEFGLALLLPGLASRDKTLLGVAWSLDIELQFYLALPLLAPLLIHLRRAEVWLLALIGWVVGIGLMSAGLVTALFFLPAFAGGAWLAQSRWKATDGQAFASVLLFMAAGAGLALLPLAREVLLKNGIETPNMAVQLTHLGWSVLLLPAVAWSVHQYSSAQDRWAGDLSFSLYLVHTPVITARAALMPAGGLALKLAMLLISAVLAVALHRWVDLPAELWRRAHFRNPVPIPPAAIAFAPLNSGRKRPN
jgi:peptidoglycan/LPS O-acetylase OafA/YrhL